MAFVSINLPSYMNLETWWSTSLHCYVSRCSILLCNSVIFSMLWLQTINPLHKEDSLPKFIKSEAAHEIIKVAATL